jgi:hypothetical protein
MKKNPFKWLVVFILFVLLIMFFSSCNTGPTGHTTRYRVIDDQGYQYDVDTVLSTPSPHCIIIQGTNYNGMICGNYTVVSKK